MKYEITFQITAKTVITVETYQEAQQFFEDFGKNYRPFYIENPEEVEALELEEIVE